MNILIAPGAFKHSLSAAHAADTIAQGLERSGLDAHLRRRPIADGGNGTLDAFLAAGGERVPLVVHDPLLRPVDAAFGLLDEGQTAVVEMALASGIELLSQAVRDPLQTSTYGTGEMLQAALERGVKRVIIGMGGSATVDGGAGCLQALGVRLLDEQGEAVGQGGSALKDIARIDASGLDPRWQDVEIVIASDVDNPLLGERGAAAIFGPQKGATPEAVQTLEANLSHFFALIADQHGVDVREMPGSGAAGGLAAGLLAFLGGRIQSGIDLLLAHDDFDALLRETDLVITGEGHMDAQTIAGKGPLGIARLARERGVPTVALVGGLGVDDAVLHEAGFQAILPIITHPMELQEALLHAETLLERAALRLGYLLALR